MDPRKAVGVVVGVVLAFAALPGGLSQQGIMDKMLLEENIEGGRCLDGYVVSVILISKTKKSYALLKLLTTTH